MEETTQDQRFPSLPMFKAMVWDFSLENCQPIRTESSWAGRVAQVIECLPRKHEALIWNPRTTKGKKKTELKEQRALKFSPKELTLYEGVFWSSSLRILWKIMDVLMVRN
jgi:hypothetical protein